MEDLAPREREIATLCAAGESHEEISTKLEISVNTIKATMRRVYVKLGISGAGAGRRLMARRKELLG